MLLNYPVLSLCMTLAINYNLHQQKQTQMYPKNKKRAKSFIEEYQHKKLLLPFIKPRYIKEDMFRNQQPNGEKTTNPTSSIPKYTQHVRNKKCDTEPIEETNLHQESNQNGELNRIRFKLQDFYRNMRDGKIKLQTVPRQEVDSQGQYREERKINFSFAMRRLGKKYQYGSEKKEDIQIPAYQQPILQQKLLYTPILLSHNFTHREGHTIDQHQIKGVIKKQSIIKNPIRRELIKKEHSNQQHKQNIKKKLKKAFNAVLFIVYLKRYNKKFQSRRKRFVQKIGSENIQQRLVQLKLYFAHKCQPFFDALCLKHEQFFQISEKDATQSRIHKIKSIKGHLSILLECISRGVDELNGKTHLVQIIYSICKHGSFSCLWNFHTPEEFDISCISPQVGYLSGDHYLEQSYIIALIFIKIIVFNILLQPETIVFTISPLIDKTKLYFNIKLIANIYYEILITLQDSFLQLADQKFKVGNWRNLTYKFDIHTSESMTVKKGVYQKNELISGLNGHNYINDTYKIDEMNSESRLTKQLIVKLHLLMKEHHRRIRKNCM